MKLSSILTGAGQNFLFSTASKQVLEPNQTPVQWVPQKSSYGVSWPLASIQCRG